MKDIFEYRDFYYPDNTSNQDTLDVALRIAKLVADSANFKLNKLIESWPVVWFNDDKTMSPYWETSSRQDKLHTHKARLAFIEEIKKDPCNHEPVSNLDYPLNSQSLMPGKVGFSFFAFDGWVCRNCGVKIQATWSEVK